MAIEYASAGGQGDAIEPRPSRSDLILYRKAIKDGYNLSAEQRARMVRVAEALLESADERSQLGAAKVLLAADKLDLEVEKLATASAPQTVNNTQINVGTDLAKMTDDQLRAYIAARLGSGSSGA